MKKKFIACVLAAIVLTCSSAYVIKSSGGLAGYTGSPGEVTCGTPGCHGGGASAASGITLTATPSFSLGEYMPDSVYQISIQMSATGFSRFGFGCEILGKNNTNAGTMQLPGPGVKFLNAFNGRRNALHTIPKLAGTASFDFQWVAPSTPDTVTFYVMGNAVNGNGSTSGDFPLAPVSMSLSPKPLPVDPTTLIRELPSFVTKVYLYPNPA